MQAMGVVGGITPHIINFATSWRKIICLRARPIYLRRHWHRYVLNMRLIWFDSRCGHFGGRKSLLPSAGNRTVTRLLSSL
jgi:hypothetical protein